MPGVLIDASLCGRPCALTAGEWLQRCGGGTFADAVVWAGGPADVHRIQVAAGGLVDNVRSYSSAISHSYSLHSQ